MPIIPLKPGLLRLKGKFTEEQIEKLEINKEGFLTEAETNIVKFLLNEHEGVLAWEASDRGVFKEEFFEPIRFPTVFHKPWSRKNIPIPPGIMEEVIEIFKEKIANGAIEPSNSPYRSAWFCVVK